MEKVVLIIDDEAEQANAMAKVLDAEIKNTRFEAYHEEKDIWTAIEDRFYTVAIVDLRMDRYSKSGIDVIKRIFEVNPLAKVIIISAFQNEYFQLIKELLLTGRVLDVQDKKPIKAWAPFLKETIENYHNELDQNPDNFNTALMDFYSEVKNERDSYIKGARFENFISLLFQAMGFKDILKRVVDHSENEVDLIIRNEINDRFLNKLGKYILVECKNKPQYKVSKNDFIVFNAKLSNAKGSSNFGIIATSGYMTKTVYQEAMRESKSESKILFLSNTEIINLIQSQNLREGFKKIIDQQVKDN